MSENREWRNMYGEVKAVVIHSDRASADLADRGILNARTRLQSRTVSEWEDVPLVDPKPGDCVTERGYGGCIFMLVEKTDDAEWSALQYGSDGWWTAPNLVPVKAAGITAIVPHPQTGELR